MVAGPVAFGRCVEEVVVDLAGRAINVGMLYEIVGAMNQLLVSTSKGGGNRHKAGDARLCICCLLVQQASNCLDARSGGRVGCRSGGVEPILLVRGDGDSAYAPCQVFSPGAVRTKRAECFETVVNVHSSGYVLRMADELDFSDYDVSYSDELDMWLVTRRRQRCDGGDEEMV